MIVTSARAAYHLILLHSVRSEELPAPPQGWRQKKKELFPSKNLKIIISTYILINFPVNQIIPITCYIFSYINPFKYLGIKQGVNKQ